MHFNENFGRPQAKTKAGKERIKIVFPKAKQGEYTPKIVPVPQTFSKNNDFSMCFMFNYIPTEYVKTLMHKTVEVCSDEEDKPTLPDTPRPLASAYEHPQKDLIPLFSCYKH